MSDALLVMVHGSPRPEANADVYRVIETFHSRPDARAAFPRVQVAFMECNEPDIPSAIDGLVADGATSITAVPYFLHTGTHVCDDLPTLLEDAQKRHPSVTFRMGDYLGLSTRLTDILAERAEHCTSSRIRR